MGMRIAVGRYTHETMLPSQFTSSRVNPKSRTTGDKLAITGSSQVKLCTVVGYGAEPGISGGGYSFEHKLPTKFEILNKQRKEKGANHGEDPNPPPFVESVRLGKSFVGVGTRGDQLTQIHVVRIGRIRVRIRKSFL